MAITRLQKLTIERFRALHHVEIEFGKLITVICGKNGTSKSSILGIAAQIFSFRTDYTQNAVTSDLDYRAITGAEFESVFKDHFRISDKYDPPGSMNVEFELFDGYTNSKASAELALTKRDQTSRPVVRKNSTAGPDGNASRNYTHPVIYLSLKRLYPITDRDYKRQDFDYLQKHQAEFISLTNELLNKTSSAATSTSGIIKSAVSHGQNYDQDSVSAGEDNAGQLVLAIMSFRKLKEEYVDYKGGLLLIDEADAGLFPAAQRKLIEILERECKRLDLQVIMTSHSPLIVENIHQRSEKFPWDFKTIYLTDSYGAVSVKQNFSWEEINADLHAQTVSVGGDAKLPKIKVYFEDKEGHDLFMAAAYRRFKKTFLNLVNVSLGCGNYKNLVKLKIPEFSHKSIICLDGDVTGISGKAYQSIVALPGNLGPDQLIFEYLYNLPANHPIWENSIQFTRSTLTYIASGIISHLNITTDTINLKELLDKKAQEESQGKKSRERFKKFYKDPQFQDFLKLPAKHNPWQSWAKENKVLCDDFVSRFIAQLKNTLHEEYDVPKHMIERIFPKSEL